MELIMCFRFSRRFTSKGWPTNRILPDVTASMSLATANAPDCSANRAFSMIFRSFRGLIVGITCPGYLFEAAIPAAYI